MLPDATGALAPNIIIPRKVVGLLVDMARQADCIRLSIGPAAALNSIESTAPEKPGADRLAVSMTIGSANVRLSSKLIDGKFPDVNRVVPAGGDKQMLFSTAELQRAVAAISGSSRDMRATRISLLAGGKAIISAAYVSIDISVAVDVACEHSSPGFEVGFNGGYLASVLAASGGSEVLFDTADPASPMLVRNPADTAWTAVLMPMRLS